MEQRVFPEPPKTGTPLLYSQWGCILIEHSNELLDFMEGVSGPSALQKGQEQGEPGSGYREALISMRGTAGPGSASSSRMT